MRDYWWLIPVGAISFLAAILPKAYGGIAILAVAAAAAVYVLFRVRFKLSAALGRGGNPKGKHRSQERWAPKENSASTYRSLVDQMSHALLVEAEASWRTFSAAYERRGSVENALEAAFGEHPRFATFDWRDFDSCQAFVSEAGAALSPDEVFDGSGYDSVESQLRAFDVWLRLRGHILVEIDTGTDGYCCLVLPHDDAFAFLRGPSQGGATLRATGDST
jgi:hypothetical protein